MALIKCSECGNEISDKAKMCPHCGNPTESVLNTNEPHKNQLNESNGIQYKRKSYLAKAILLWPLMILEVVVLLVLLVITSGSDSLLSVIAEYIIWFFAVFNIVLGVVLAIKVFKTVRPAWKRKDKPIKNTVALVLCVAFAVFNCYCLGGAAKNALNIAPSSQYELTREEKIAVEACQDLKASMKNPGSLTLHSVLVCEDADSSRYVYIDCSGMNGFGGFTRTTYVYHYGECLGTLEDNSSAQSALSFCQTMGRCTSISVQLIEQNL